MTSEPQLSFEAAAAHSGVVVRTLTELTELHEAAALLGEIWGVPDKPPMNAELLRALAKADSYVAGAYDGATMVGVCVGFHAAPAARAMHSHIAGVTPAMAGRHVGFALKLHQRAWCLDRGISLLEWTFDPLVARNAYFNLGKLGARVAEYLPDFYGAMGDGINRFDQTDRILVHWSLEDAAVVDACAGTPRRTVVPPRCGSVLGRRSPRRRAAAAGRPRTSPELAPEGARAAHHRPGHRWPRGGIRQGARLPRAPGRRRSPVKLQGVELRRVAMPLVSPFRTSFGTQTARDILLLRAVTTSDRGDAEGWGECVAMSDPLYSSEYVDATADVLRRFLLPELAASADRLDRHGAHAVASVLHKFKGHRMAKAALEMAVLDAELRTEGRSWARELGAVHDRVPSGVSVGIFDSIPALLDAVDGYLDAGYVRIKLKIEPGWDVEPVRAVRERFGDEVLLQVDANTAYTLRDARHLARLDAFDLLLIEQPLEEEDVLGHAELARRISTPVCLDESIVSAQTAAAAISLGACAVINIKPGRVGGYLEAVRIHDLAAAHGLAVWCGGMVETGLGRAANAALGALPGFTLPGDISASDRFYATDITEPLVLEDGHMAVPTGPGLGVTPIPEVLESVTTSTEWIPL